MTVKHKPARFRLERIEMVSMEVLPRDIPFGWMALRTIAIPVAKGYAPVICSCMVDPKRYKTDKKFKKEVLEALREVAIKTGFSKI